MSKLKTRYVEVSYRLPGDELAQFRCIIVDADSPSSALEMTIADTKEAHPDAFEIEEFMQRSLTEQQAEKIGAAINNGTWEGWKF